MSKPVIMFPCYLIGRGNLDHLTSFITTLKAIAPTAVLVPVLNGWVNEDALKQCVLEAEHLSLEPISAIGNLGLRSALQSGYATISRRFAENPIVRLDTTEHPPEAIPDLLEVAKTSSTLVVGDLTNYSDKLMPLGSQERLVHEHIFPTLYEVASLGKVRLSCAHGFQVFPSGKLCRIVIDRTQQIMQLVDRMTNKTVSWGFDGATALAGAATIGVTVVPLEGTTERNRSAEKLADQFRGALLVCQAAQQLQLREDLCAS